MINHIYITGDCHGEFSRLKNVPNKEDVALIILGDAGFNFWLNKTDHKWKKKITDLYKFTIYCVRGNHEARPQDIFGMICEWDADVNGYVYYQIEYPRIKYFKDWGIYTICNYTFAVVGGAYSVDKYYRLNRAGLTEATNQPEKSGWWNNEQLTQYERIKCLNDISCHTVDFVLTHTCPINWEPTDLFLNVVNQDTVDKTMENFLQDLERTLIYRCWLFGHYHADRIEHWGVEMFYKDIENIEDIIKRQDKIELDTHHFYYRVPRGEFNVT